MTALLEPLLANRTPEWLYIRVSPHMLTEVDRLRETFATYNALERLDFRMGPQMLVQTRLLCESFPAKLANEWSNAIVHTHMLLQTTDLSKALGTN